MHGSMNIKTVDTPCTIFANTVVFWLINTFYDFVLELSTGMIRLFFQNVFVNYMMEKVQYESARNVYFPCSAPIPFVT